MKKIQIVKKILKISGIVLASIVVFCALFYTIAVAVVGSSFSFTDKIDISEYPDDVKIVYESIKYNVPSSDSAFIATLVEDDGTNCTFEIDMILYSEVAGKDYMGNDVNKNIYNINKKVKVTVSDDEKPYHILDSFSLIADTLYPCKNINKYWNRDNLLCPLEVGKSYLLMVDDDSYTTENPYHEAELVFIIDADFPYDSNNYESITSYALIIHGGYTGYSKDYTGFR